MVVADLASRFGGDSFAPLSPGVEEAALGGEESVESDEEQRRPGRSGAKLRDEFEGKAGGAEQVGGAAGGVEGGKPGAEVFRVLLPGGAGGFAKELRGVGAEELMGLHGEAGHAVAGAFKQGCHVAAGADDLCPEGLLLERIEEQAAVAGGGWSGGAQESLPVVDGGGGPGLQAFIAARAVEGGGEGAGGALTGGDDEAPVAEPCVDFGLLWRSGWIGWPHFSVIRHWGIRVLGLWVFMCLVFLVFMFWL